LILTVKTSSKNMSSSPLSSQLYYSYPMYSNKLNSLKINTDYKDKLISFGNELFDMSRKMESLHLSKQISIESVRQRSRNRICPSPPRPSSESPYCWSNINK
jgi:hypothetical protein